MTNFPGESLDHPAGDFHKQNQELPGAVCEDTGNLVRAPNVLGLPGSQTCASLSLYHDLPQSLHTDLVLGSDNLHLM